jgi:predicted NBD/HSP70 family sugar kinase
METSDARQVSRSSVLAAIATAGQATRAQLAGATGLSASTVSRVTDSLLADGLIAEGAPVESGQRGRNAVSLTVRTDLGLVCGIDLGATNCRFLLANMLGAPVALSHEPTPAGIGAAALAEWLGSRVGRLVADAGTAAGEARAVVVGLPGMVTPDGSTITAAPNVPQIEGQMFARKLTRAMPAPVTLYNDADLALLGEMRFGAGRGLPRAVMFTIGTGLGAGVYLDGALLRGRCGMVGEFGYLQTGPSGERAEELLSGTGLLRQATALRAPVTDAAQVFAPELEGLLGPVLERFDRALVLTLVAAIVAYDPSVIILGGGLSPAISRRLTVTRSRLTATLPAVPELRLAELGDLSGALGALVVACQQAFAALGVSPADAAALPPARLLRRLWARSAHGVRYARP